MTLVIKNVIQDEDLLSNYIFPYLINIENRSETTNLKRVCKLWNELLNNSYAFPEQMSIRDSFINHYSAFVSNKYLKKLKIVRTASKTINKKYSKYIFKNLPTDSNVVKLAYIKRYSSIEPETLNNKISNHIMIFGLVAIFVLYKNYIIENIINNKIGNEICIDFNSTLYRIFEQICRNSTNSFTLSPSYLFSLNTKTIINLNCQDKLFEFSPFVDQDFISDPILASFGIATNVSEVNLHIGNVLSLMGATLAPFLLAAKLALAGRFTRIRDCYQSVLSLDAPIRQSISLKEWRQRMRDQRSNMGCVKKAFTRIACIFYGIRNAFRDFEGR